MKPVDVKPSMHIDYNIANNKESCKFKVIQKDFCISLCSKSVRKSVCDKKNQKNCAVEISYL